MGDSTNPPAASSPGGLQRVTVHSAADTPALSAPTPDSEPDPESRAVGKPERWSTLRKTLRHLRKLHLAFLLPVVAAPWLLKLSGFEHQIPDFEHFLLTLSAMALVHLLDRLVIFHDTQNALDELRAKIVHAVSGDTSASLAKVQSELTSEFSATATTLTSSIEQQLQHRFELLERAGQCGLDAMWLRRDDDTVREIGAAIDQAQRRIWITAVVFSGKLDLDARFESLKRKVDDGVDVKVALLEPQSVAAIFRTAIESAEGTRQEFETFLNSGGASPDVFHNGAVWGECQRIRRKLKHNRGDQRLQDAFRYYTHNPSCFLVIADDTAYYQPYTFGYDSRDKDEKLVGLSMPVWRFRAATSGGPPPQQDVFKTLEDHFKTTWATCREGSDDADTTQRIKTHLQELLNAVHHRERKAVAFGADSSRAPVSASKIDNRHVTVGPDSESRDGKDPCVGPA